jgi:hypothetical protein
MPKVLISEAQPGQILRRPALTRSGLVMVQPGTELTESIIERLKTIGIDSVHVEGTGSGPEKPLEVALQELDARFAGHERDPWMQDLKAIIARHLRAAASSDHA